ncbi:MAG: aldose 1-epimerase [Betaproteobacteria bacterium]|nr:aldose 1-epimerase [Betaproteobacteria bacterium]
MILQLTHGDSAAIICPKIGGSIAQFTWRGYHILRPAPDTVIRDSLVRQMGFYPLVPYSNRIGHGKLFANGETFQLRANAPPEPHALHGFGWQREWQVESQSDSAVTLALVHAADADWPFACEAREVIELVDDALHITLSLRNTDPRLMPAGLGFHPFFPIDRSTLLQAEWQAMWAMGPDKLPTERIAVPPEADFRQPSVVDGWTVDNCFTGWNRVATLSYATHQVRIEASEACRQTVCFAPNDGRNFIAIELVTNINDAFSLMARGVTDTGLQLINGGEAVRISTTLYLTSTAA